MSLLNSINNVCKSFGFQIHGNGYLEKISRNNFKNNAFEIQKDFFKNKEINIIDAGANVGNISSKYQDLFPNSRIYSFEPFQEAFNELNERFNSDSYVKTFRKGLNDSSGKIRMNVNRISDTNSILESDIIGASSDKSVQTVSDIEIEVTTVDDFLQEQNINHIEILKMDVQGAELKVLEGSVIALKNQGIDLIYTEVYFKRQYKNQPLFSDLESHLRKLGYVLVDLYDLYYNQKQILWGDAIFVRETLL